MSRPIQSATTSPNFPVPAAGGVDDDAAVDDGGPPDVPSTDEATPVSPTPDVDEFQSSRPVKQVRGYLVLPTDVQWTPEGFVATSPGNSGSVSDLLGSAPESTVDEGSPPSQGEVGQAHASDSAAAVSRDAPDPSRSSSPTDDCKSGDCAPGTATSSAQTALRLPRAAHELAWATSLGGGVQALLRRGRKLHDAFVQLEPELKEAADALSPGVQAELGSSTKVEGKLLATAASAEKAAGLNEGQLQGLVKQFLAKLKETGRFEDAFGAMKALFKGAGGVGGVAKSLEIAKSPWTKRVGLGLGAGAAGYSLYTFLQTLKNPHASLTNKIIHGANLVTSAIGLWPGLTGIGIAGDIGLFAASIAGIADPASPLDDSAKPSSKMDQQPSSEDAHPAAAAA